MSLTRISLFVIAASLALRFITFMVSVNYGADSISRSLISLNWAKDPFLVWHPNNTTSVWLPLQFYINGIALMIWDNVQLVPRLVSLFASILSLPIFFGLAGRMFNREKVWFATACFSLYALHVKYGNIAGSESLFILTVLLTMYASYRLLSRQDLIDFLLLGGTLLVAAMIRFEAWLLPPFIIAAVFLRENRLDSEHRRRMIIGVLVSSVPAFVFMLIWMIGSHQHYGDFLYSIHAATAEHSDLTAQSVGSVGNMKILIYRALFWPGVILISLSPLILLCGLRGAVLSIFRKTNAEWAVFLVLIICIYLYQSLIAGKLAPLARYTVLPGTILCLYTAWDYEEKSAGWKSLPAIFNPRLVMVTALVWSILLLPNYRDFDNGYLKKLASISPVTRYPKSLEPVIRWLNANLNPDQTVLFNSPSFNTNAIIMYSGITPSQFISANEQSREDMIRKYEATRPTYFVCHKDAPILKHIETNPADSSISLNNNILRLKESVGDYGIYIAAPEQNE